MTTIQRPRKDIAKSYLPEIEKFYSFSSDALVQGFALELGKNANQLFLGEITLATFNDKKYLNPLEASADENKIARSSLNYIKDRIIEFWVDGTLTTETAS
jgi:hypothetical protein